MLLDALGTLVELEPPAPRLRAAARRGAASTSVRAARSAGFAAEIAYYLAHHLEGGDPASLEDLRDRCATVMLEALGAARPRSRRGAPGDARRRWRSSPSRTRARPARAARRGLRLVVASNWDCSLPDWLERAGLLELVDGVVSSAEVGAAKPAPAVFAAALELAGAEPGEALHVGDSLDNDVEGARAAGLRAVLVARDGGARPARRRDAVRSLEELPSLV